MATPVRVNQAGSRAIGYNSTNTPEKTMKQLRQYHQKMADAGMLFACNGVPSGADFLVGSGKTITGVPTGAVCVNYASASDHKRYTYDGAAWNEITAS